MATVYRVFRLEHYLAVIVLLPVLWAFGHLTPVVSYPFQASRFGVLQNEALLGILVLQASAFAAALLVGFVVAFFARGLGHAAIRTLLSPAQALLFGILATATLWIAVTGLNWASFRQNEPLTIIWYIITGTAQALFGTVWLMLAVRAAASMRPFQAAANLITAAEGCFCSALGGILLLLVYLQNAQPDPSLALVGVELFLVIALFVVPPAIAVTAGAALWGGVLAARDRRDGRRSGDGPAAPAD